MRRNRRQGDETGCAATNPGPRRRCAASPGAAPARAAVPTRQGRGTQARYPGRLATRDPPRNAP
ncbi:hypothetical protein GLE_0517 [Lysobacter enzymogenes]|uniref:Uncharacterized protein n=1 Tax=Lysobacter enzymogenes TaxID=69 RepID=A0A0S2DBH2_LYSEN|nr:hypothetical protein GLE_0517 [Lysobacter enzymogenes]